MVSGTSSDVWEEDNSAATTKIKTHLLLGCLQPAVEGLCLLQVAVHFTDVSEGLELFELLAVALQFLHKPVSSQLQG